MSLSKQVKKRVNDSVFDGVDFDTLVWRVKLDGDYSPEIRTELEKYYYFQKTKITSPYTSFFSTFFEGFFRYFQNWKFWSGLIGVLIIGVFFIFLVFEYQFRPSLVQEKIDLFLLDNTSLDFVGEINIRTASNIDSINKHSTIYNYLKHYYSGGATIYLKADGKMDFAEVLKFSGEVSGGIRSLGSVLPMGFSQMFSHNSDLYRIENQWGELINIGYFTAPQDRLIQILIENDYQLRRTNKISIVNGEYSIAYQAKLNLDRLRNCDCLQVLDRELEQIFLELYSGEKEIPFEIWVSLRDHQIQAISLEYHHSQFAVRSLRIDLKAQR